jgi:hypothetical protein
VGAIPRSLPREKNVVSMVIMKNMGQRVLLANIRNNCFLTHVFADCFEHRTPGDLPESQSKAAVFPVGSTGWLGFPVIL